MSINNRFMQRFCVSALLLLGAVQSNAEIEPTKSANDAMEYAALVLPNEMKVLLVSDPSTDKASAALTVSVGAANDPIERGGIAHFLEHMLFLGTEKYPEPDEYQAFVRANGGTHNAFTSFEFTTYYFDIEANKLEPALDRFSQFFIAPLFNSRYVEREKHAVDSEYQARLKDDSRRRVYAQKDIANPRHPFSNFQSGNLETLNSDGDHSIRDDLLKFYAENYSANLMALAVVGKQPLDELRVMVDERFSAVPNTNAKCLEIDEPLFEEGRLPVRLNVIPNKEQRSASMMFPIPSMRAHYLSKPAAYVGHLLGHEGKGSLLSLLKNKGWVDSLSAGSGLSTPGSATFSINVELTEAGLANVNAITGYLFEQLRQIQEDGVNQWIFEEQKKLSELAFRFQEKSDPARYAIQLSSNQHIYPKDDIIRGPYAMDIYDPAAIRNLLGHLTPENLLLTVIAKDLKTNRVTRWFETPYDIERIDDSTLSAWRAASIDAALSLPEPNPFIPDDLALKPMRNDVPVPVRVETIEGVELWHKQELRFGTPRTDFFVSLRSKHSNSSVRNSLLTGLYTSIVNDQLTEFSYPAMLAGVNFQLYPHMRGFSFRVSGYSDKQPLLVKKLVETLANPKIDRERFTIIKERQLRRLRSARLERPYTQTMAQLSKLLVDPNWTIGQRISALVKLTDSDLREFVPQLLSQISIVALAHGNLLRTEAITLTQVVKDNLLPENQSESVAHSRVVSIAPGASFVRELDIEHSDSAITLYLQGENKSMRSRARSSLLVQLLSSPFYTQLRTEKQLGYIVFVTTSTLLEVPGISFVIQSPVAHPRDLRLEIKSFLQTQHESLRNLSDDEFNTYRDALVTRILDEDKSLASVSDRYWSEIDRQHYNFDSRERLADALRSIEKPEMVEFYERTVLSNLRKQLVVLTVGDNHRDIFTAHNEGDIVIPNLEDFRKGRNFFPSIGLEPG